MAYIDIVMYTSKLIIMEKYHDARDVQKMD